MTSLPLALVVALYQQPTTYQPDVKAASSEGLHAIAGFHVAPGFTIDLFAAEPMLANPVAFTFDERGRCFVCETFRIHAGVIDMRDDMDWLDQDLKNQTVAERVAMTQQLAGESFASYSSEHERVRLIEDRDGDGHADQASVFADQFHDPADGLIAGVLARRGQVYVTCIPKLWRLADPNGDGVADQSVVLHDGFGVKFSLIGHDLHGLRIGPDGKLYFSCGDRALNVATKDGAVKLTTCGAVLRMNLDGSELELVHTGLRNPQELAFNELGDLFTGDNNSDGGDRARFVHVVEGGDSGWRYGYQWMNAPYRRGPWNAERQWEPQFPGQAAFLVPPIINLGNGPSGLTFQPGTGWPEHYRDHFFLCDFSGEGATSVVHTFRLVQSGASYQLADHEDFLTGCLATDVDFGPDGALYVSDWVHGWNKSGKGRIYRITPPPASDPGPAREVAVLLADGMTQRSTEALARLLAHADQRVRLEAQLALAERGEAAITALVEIARVADFELARLHAIWGLGQIARRSSTAHAPLLDRLFDGNPEVRAQVAKVLGDAHVAAAAPEIVKLLQDPAPRVRFFASIALGKLRHAPALEPLINVLRDNGDHDPYVRHAAAMGLVGAAKEADLLRLREDKSTAVRLGAVIALRRMNSAAVARFLDDLDPLVVLEAARAVNDVPIAAAMPQLAAVLDRQDDHSEAVLRRALNASLRLGRAQAVADLVKRAAAPPAARVEALALLAQWDQPSARDRIVGEWRPFAAPAGDQLPDLVRSLVHDTLNTAPPEIQEGILRLVGHYRVPGLAPVLASWVRDPTHATTTRVTALDMLADWRDPALQEAVRVAIADPDAQFASAGYRSLASLDGDVALPLLEQALASDSIAQRQGALQALSSFTQPRAITMLGQQLDELIAGKMPPALQLDVLLAAQQPTSPDLAAKIATYQSSLLTTDTLAEYRVCEQGGDAQHGRSIFRDKQEASCLRCHSVADEGRTRVGPNLAGVGTRRTRAQILESILDPNREIAEGFGKVLVVLKNGEDHDGRVVSETAVELQLQADDGAIVMLPVDQIETRQATLSAMPENMRELLTKSELRDVVEYLAGLQVETKQEPPPAESRAEPAVSGK